MKILITNDDGILSPVLPTLAKWATDLGEVTVVAPKHEQSGKSQSIDFFREVEIKRYDLGVNCEAWAMDSTPADCVRFATIGLDRRYDLVLSGINRGFNLGDDISYSGTVGAILEASRLGHRAIALSTDTFGFDAALAELDSVYQYVIEKDLLSYTDLLNINFPNQASKGICLTRQGGMFYSDEFVCKGNDMYIQVGEHVREGSDLSIDIHAILNGYISITPLTAQKTDFAALEKMKN
jgi:5'-nucleotidase